MIYSLLAFLVFIRDGNGQVECLERTLIPMSSPHFLLTSQFNKPNVCLCCSLLFFPQLFHLDQMVSLLLYFPLS